MLSIYQLIFVVIITYCHTRVTADTKVAPSTTQLVSIENDNFATLNFDESIWNDDYLFDANGVNGWSLSDIVGTDDISYHGPFNNQGATSLKRYVNIGTYSIVSITLDFIWVCDPEPYSGDNQGDDLGDYFYVTLGDKTSRKYSYSATNSEIVRDAAVTDKCTTVSDDDDKAWRKTVTFEAISAPDAQYLVQITSYLSNTIYLSSPWNEYVFITNIQINVSPLCDLSPFNPTVEIIEAYLESVGNDDEKCRNSLQLLLLKEQYGINIATDNDYDGNYFGVVPLSPSDITNALDFDADDIDTIANILEESLANLLPSQDIDIDDDELDTICPQLNTIYNNIADLQRRMLMGMDPTSNTDDTVLIERDHFCSFTNRISTDLASDGDGFYEIEVQNAVIRIPYDMINIGREEWRSEDMDSIDIAVMCVDNVLLNHCNGASDIVDEYEYAINVDISVDTAGASIPFIISFPYSEENKDKVCGWVSHTDEEWQYDGCKTTVTSDAIVCECNHRTVFSLIEDLRLETAVTNAKSLQGRDMYIGFLLVYSLLAVAATYLVVNLYLIRDMKSLASIIVSVITVQIYCHVMQYIYLSFADLQNIPLGVTYCVISLPLLCHFWVCSLLILHWMKIFECAKTFTADNKTLDNVMIAMNVVVSVAFICLLIASTVVPEDHLQSIVSASNGILGSVGITFCIAWSYFGLKTSTILMASANSVKDSCAVALTEALIIRRRLLRLTFVIGFCFFTQSMIAILSVIENLQLFADNFINFATIWAICDVIIFVTFIMFYHFYVVRQKDVYNLEQKARDMEREMKRSRRDNTITIARRKSATPCFTSKPSNSPVARKSTTTLPPTIHETAVEIPQHPQLRLSPSITCTSPSSAAFDVPTIPNTKSDSNILPSSVYGGRVSISTASTVTTLKNANSLTLDDVRGRKRSKRTKTARVRSKSSHDDGALHKRRAQKLKNRTRKDLLQLDKRSRVRSHSASPSPSISRESSLETSVSPKRKTVSKKGRKAKKRIKVQSDSLVKPKKKKKGTRFAKKIQSDKKKRNTSHSLSRTKKKKTTKEVKSVNAKPKSYATRGKKPSEKKSDKKKKVSSKSKTSAKKTKPMEPKQYDDNEANDEIERTLHEMSKRSSVSSTSSIASGVKDIAGLILTVNAKNNAMSKKPKKKMKLRKAKSQTDFKKKKTDKASRTKIVKTQAKNTGNKVSSANKNKKKKKSKIDK